MIKSYELKKIGFPKSIRNGDGFATFPPKIEKAEQPFFTQAAPSTELTLSR